MDRTSTLATAVLLLPLLSPGAPAHATSDKQCAEVHVCMGTEPDGDGLRFVLENRSPVVIRATVDFPVRENLEASAPLPVEVRVPPGESAGVVTLAPSDRGAAYRYAASVSLAWGDAETTRPDPDARYALPFGGDVPRTVSQTTGFSHVGIHRHAIDFEMPEGTPVLAARAGVVLKIEDGFQEGGLDPRFKTASNAVLVAHADGTIAHYGHLRAGIPVEPGDEVAVGDLLGWSGATGYGSGPHLHFHVGTVSEEVEGFTIPVRFDDGSAEGFVPEAGGSYGPAAPRAQADPAR